MASAPPAAADVDPPPSPTAGARAPAEAARAASDPCAASDDVPQKVAPILYVNGQSAGQVELWHSRSTRCVFGAVQVNPGTPFTESAAALAKADDVRQST
jgi:hypothetical protein